MKNKRPIWGQNIRERRKALNWNQDELAEKAGLSVGVVKQIEAGPKEGKFQSREAIAKALNCTVADLYAPVWAKKIPPRSTAKEIAEEVRLVLMPEIASATRREEFEIMRLKKEIRRLKNQIKALPAEFWTAWSKAQSRVQAAFLFLVIGREEDLRRASTSPHFRQILASLRKDLESH